MKTMTHRTLVALKLPGSLGLFISFVRSVLLAIAGNPHFPNPSPPLATVDAAVSDLEKAQTAVQARVHGAVETRDAKRAALTQLVDALRVHVQGIADLDPPNAVNIIQSAGFAVHKLVTHGKRAFRVTQGAASGSVNLTAPATRRAAYDWQWSIDGGKTWQNAPSTLQAKTAIAGFVAGTTVSFRFRANTKAADGEWSQPIALVVR